MRDFLADNGRPLAITAAWGTLVTAGKPLLFLAAPPEWADAIYGVLVAIGPLLGFFIPRRSVERKAQLQALGEDPVSRARPRD